MLFKFTNSACCNWLERINSVLWCVYSLWKNISSLILLARTIKGKLCSWSTSKLFVFTHIIAHTTQITHQTMQPILSNNSTKVCMSCSSWLLQKDCEVCWVQSVCKLVSVHLMRTRGLQGENEWAHFSEVEHFKSFLFSLLQLYLWKTTRNVHSASAEVRHTPLSQYPLLFYYFIHVIHTFLTFSSLNSFTFILQKVDNLLTNVHD